MSKKAEEINEPSHFGDCPHCFKATGRFRSDGHINVGSVNFFICRSHKVACCVGSGLFSDADLENDEIWARNLRMLEEEYEPVEAYHPPAWLMRQISAEPFKRN